VGSGVPFLGTQSWQLDATRTPSEREKVFRGMENSPLDPKKTKHAPGEPAGPLSKEIINKVATAVEGNQFSGGRVRRPREQLLCHSLQKRGKGPT